MSLSPGDRIGPYEVVGLLGAGGMGEVYRARDTRLSRDVALKVLPAIFAADPDRLARFKREAQVLASLNHANIGAIYGFEDHALVLELVDGPTLADRIAQGPIPLDDALPIARQIADALGAAHEHGVIHRDLKPANIKLRPDGTVKVLDFGLAKAFAQDAVGSGVSAGLSMSPTITSPAATGIGMILGTAAYMSPEQARGKSVDKRSDIWAFGCIVFEMLTGRRLFAGDDVMETIAAVINKAPDWGAVPPGTPGAMRATLERCLQRDPKQRIHDIADARLALDGAFESRTSARTQAAPSSSLRRLVPIGVAAVLASVLTGIAVSWMLPRSAMPVSGPIRFEVEAPAAHTLPYNGFALSPDGRHLAFLADAEGRPSIWLHSFDTSESKLLTPNFVVNNVPFWSPDSRQLAFYATGILRKVTIDDGLVQPIGEVPGTSQGSWNRDGVILIGRSGSTILRLDSGGASHADVTSLDPDRQERGHTGPVFLPDGRHFLYSRLSTAPDKSGVFVGSLDARPQDQDRRMLAATPFSPGYAPTSDPRIGYLFFVRDRTLFAQRFDNTALAVIGSPTPVADNIGDNGNATALFSVSAAGLTYRQGLPPADGSLVWVDRTGRETGALGPARLKRPEFPRLSPDGRRVALTVDGDVWLYDVDDRPPIKMTFGGEHYSPLWTTDSRQIVYEGVPPAPLFLVPADGSRAAPQPVSPVGHYHPHGWSADGRWLLAVRLAQGPNAVARDDIIKIEIGNPENVAPVVETPGGEGLTGAALSPDGRWLAYVSDATGAREIWIQPFPGPGAPVRVSPAGGVEPVWARNGRELFYLEGNDLMSVSIDTSAGFSFKPSVRLFTNRYLLSVQPPSFDVAANGRFLMIKPADTAVAVNPMRVLMNWADTVRDLK